MARDNKPIECILIDTYDGTELKFNSIKEVSVYLKLDKSYVATCLREDRIMKYRYKLRRV